MNAAYTGCYICEPTGSRIIKKDENSRKWKRKNERKINKIKEKKKNDEKKPSENLRLLPVSGRIFLI